MHLRGKDTHAESSHEGQSEGRFSCKSLKIVSDLGGRLWYNGSCCLVKINNNLRGSRRDFFPPGETTLFGEMGPSLELRRP
jgi:hypothetical protein